MGVVVAGVVADGTGEVVVAAVVAAALVEGDAAGELTLPEALDPEAELPDPLPTQVVEATKQIQHVSDRSQTRKRTLTRLYLHPALIVKAADWAVAPVLSRRVNPMEVPAAISLDHVNEVPVCWPRFSRAAALGWFPGRMDCKHE